MGRRTRNLLRGVPRDRSSHLVFLAEDAIFETLGIALSLSLLVFSVTLDTTLLARGLPAFEASNVSDGLLDLAHGVLQGAGSLAAQSVRTRAMSKTAR